MGVGRGLTLVRTKVTSLETEEPVAATTIMDIGGSPENARIKSVEEKFTDNPACF